MSRSATPCRPIQGPETYLRKTRDGRTLEVKTRPLPDGGVVRTFTDMTDYVQAQEALAQQQAMLRALINNIPDRIWLKDADGVYLLSNPAHQRQHGLSEQEIIGRTAHELFGDVYGDDYRRADLLTMASTAPVVYEDRLVNRETGEVQYYELVKVAMRDEAGRCTGLLGIARDITARKESEAALIMARDAADAGNRAKAEFLANMSHEIRTPMNAVIGMSDLLLETPLTATQREFAETIRTGGETLMALINGILEFSRLESGQMDLEHLPVNLSECLEGALDLTRKTASEKGPGAAGPDRGRCSTGHPWRHDPASPGLHQPDPQRREVHRSRRGRGRRWHWRQAPGGTPLLKASVRDTGIGIAPDRLHRLFQSFSQVDASTTRQYGGTGLGLAICRRLVTMMGGRIWVDSTVGKGSCFQFELPCQAVASAPASAISDAAAGLKGRRVLLVDDNASSLRDPCKRRPRRWGMLSRAAGSGHEALGLARCRRTFRRRHHRPGNARHGRPGADARAAPALGPGANARAGADVARHRAPAALRSGPGAGPEEAGTGAGACATRWSPHWPAPATSTAAIALAAQPAPVPQLALQIPLRILLAEDNAINLRVASLILSGLGYDIQVAGNGQQVLDRMAAALPGEAFDVVLMDVQMPVLDGLEASRRLSELHPGASRPWIIAMTANAMEGDREKCLAAGMDDYLAKPVRAAVHRRRPAARQRGSGGAPGHAGPEAMAPGLACA